MGDMSSRLPGTHTAQEYLARAYTRALKKAYATGWRDGGILAEYRRGAKERGEDLEDEEAVRLEEEFCRANEELLRRNRHEFYTASLALAYQLGQRDDSILRRLEDLHPFDVQLDDAERRQLDLRFEAELNLFLRRSALRSGPGYEALSALVQGRTEGLIFVEVLPSGLYFIPVRVSQIGVPYIDVLKEQLIGWGILLPDVTEDELELKWQLAGRSHFDPAYGDVLRQQLLNVTETLGGRESYEFVLIRRCHGWAYHRLIEETLRDSGCRVVCQDVGPAASVARDPKGQVSKMIELAPLRYDYALLVANIDPRTGQVLLSPQILYGAGASKEVKEHASQEITSASNSGELFLVVFARRGERLEDLTDEDLIACARTNLPARRRCVVQTRLRAPGIVEITTDAGGPPVRPQRFKLSELGELLPKRLERSNARTLDLVFILDRICSETGFAERRDYINRVIDNVQKELKLGAELRLGVIAYGSHNHSHYARGEQALKYAPLTKRVGDVQAFLEELEPEAGRNFEADFESALELLYGLDWSPSGRHVAVAVGNRPPHPYRQAADRRWDSCHALLDSPREYDWRMLLAGARHYLSLHFISVYCPVYWPGVRLPPGVEDYALACWHDIGYTAGLRLESAPPDKVAKIIAPRAAEDAGNMFIPLLAGAARWIP